MRTATSILLVLFIALAPNRADAAPPLRAADSEPRHAVFVELGGTGLLGSVNYDYRLVPNASFRVGLGLIPTLFSNDADPVLSASIQALLYEGSHHIEVGCGMTTVLHASSFFVVPEVGYRYQPTDGGIFVRLMVTPLVPLDDPKDIIPSIGLSIGGTW